MEVLSYCLLLLFASLSYSLREQLSIAPHDSLEVPGKNPLVYCEDPTDYILDIHRIDLTPNPPEAGKNLSIKASGYLDQDVKKNSTVSFSIRIKVGGSSIPLIKEKRDLCDQLESEGEECPVTKGEISFRRNVTLPKEIPKATYLVFADVLNEDEERVTCVKASVEF